MIGIDVGLLAFAKGIRCSLLTVQVTQFLEMPGLYCCQNCGPKAFDMWPRLVPRCVTRVRTAQKSRQGMTDTKGDAFTPHKQY
jgi:hypothetical protein